MKKIIAIFIFTLTLFPDDSRAQDSGRIYFSDSTTIEIVEFTEFRTELYYYRNTNDPGNNKNASIDIMRNYSPEKIREISFTYEKRTGTKDFYYQFLLEGISSDGSTFRRKIKTWDWLEINTPESGSGRNTEIIFFIDKKKLDILKIKFE